jgi:hypothetical protein
MAGAVLFWSTAVGALLPIADAYAERASLDARSHVEQPGGSSACARVHDDACQICRVVRLAGVRPEPAGFVVVVAATTPVESEAAGDLASRVAPSAFPRAPPLS